MKDCIIKQIKNDAHLRNSFFDLAKHVFDISFVDWYSHGYWSDSYIPYAYVKNNEVIANASVNVMDFLWMGKSRHYIQIGTVMTHPKYRHQGYARKLLQEIISDWHENCDAIYLYGHEGVVSFYPQFGFTSTVEYQYQLLVTAKWNDFRKLDIDNVQDQKILLQCYEKSNPFSNLAMINNVGLLMYYCLASRKNNLYYSHAYHVVGICRYHGDTVYCDDIFGETNADLMTIVNAMAKPHTKKAILGFTPKDDAQCLCSKRNSDDILFLYANKENIYEEKKIMFPLLSHA